MSVAVCLHPSVPQKQAGPAFPSVTGVQTLLASGERQRRDRASGKRQCTQLLRRGRGNLGWRWGKEKRGEGAEVKVVCMRVCGSVSIVGATFFPPHLLLNEWMESAGPATALGTVSLILCVTHTNAYMLTVQTVCIQFAYTDAWAYLSICKYQTNERSNIYSATYKQMLPRL